jgi:hypothetical protein
MRTALLIGLMITASLASSAQAQTNPYLNPFGMGPAKDPYDLPKAFQGNPNYRDYSKPDPATKGPGYRNVDGSLPTQRQSGSSSGGFYSGYGSRSSGPSDYGVRSGNRQNPNCSKPGVVC